MKDAAWKSLYGYALHEGRKLLTTDDYEYKDISSELHERWKLSGKTDFMVNSDYKEVAHYLYLHNLLGRTVMEPKSSPEEEVKTRINVE